MEQLVVEVPEGLVKELEAYKGNLGEVLALGLRQIKMQQALVLFREAGVSLWKAARIAARDDPIRCVSGPAGHL